MPSQLAALPWDPSREVRGHRGHPWGKSWEIAMKTIGSKENRGIFDENSVISVIISPLSPQNHTKMTKNKVLDTSKPGNVGQLSDLNGWFYRWEKDIALWLMDCSSATFDYRRILGDIVGISWKHILFNTSQHF